MEQLDFASLENALGIYHPWRIQNVVAHSEAKRLDVHLGFIDDTKRKFPLFASQRQKASTQTLIDGSWDYINVGTYRCVIHGQVPTGQLGDSALTQEIVSRASFLGSPQRKYSNYLRQAIVIGQLRGLDAPTLRDLYRIDEAVIESVLNDFKQASVAVKTLCYVPTELDAVWMRVLLDQQHIKTNSLPLKLLLSKLRLALTRANTASEKFAVVVQLRDFFVAQAASLDVEIDQLCGLNTDKLRQRAQAQKSKMKLVLPSINNPLWLDIVSGKLRLNSQSVPLNLLISRQRNAFLSGKTTQEKIAAIETIREYFRKNYRSLKAELLLINRVMDIREKTSVRLPEPSHEIWQKILADEHLLPSNHMAYKLLLVKLRSEVSAQRDPVVRMEAAKRIYNFVEKNQNSMRTELDTLLKLSKAV